MTLVFGVVSRTAHFLQGDYRHCSVHFEPVSIGAMSELVTERLNFLSLLLQVLHVVIKAIAHLEVKCSVWYKWLFVQHEHLPCFQKHISMKTSWGLNWQM